jgi:hypothetical protein
VLALTIKTKEESALEPVTPAPLLLPFKEVKGLNVRILRSLFLFGGKVPKAKGNNSKSDRFMSLEDNFIASFPQKRRARKASKKFLRKKLKIWPAEFLASSRASRKKGKVAIITKANREEIIKKLQLK